MADTDDTIMIGEGAKAGAAKASSADKSSKSALRRKMVGRNQTSLSSRSPVVLSSEDQPLLNVSKPEAPIASMPDLVEAPSVALQAVKVPTVEVALPTVPGTDVPAIDLPASESAADEPTPPVLATTAAIAKRGVGRPRKVPVAASSFAEAVTAVEPAAAEPAKTEVVSDDTLSIDAADAGTLGQSGAPIGVAPTEAAVDPAAEPVITVSSTTPNPIPSSVSSIKDMTMNMSANFNGFQGAMSEAQAKAQAAFEKSSSMLSEAGDFAKGNVEAIVESSKIFAEGVQTMGSSMVSEGRTAFEAMTGDIKELAAVKSPTDFFKLQSEMVRKNFDNAVAQSSKNTETLLKLMSDAFAPVSGRVSLAVEKARQVSPLNTVSAPMTVNA